jgi:hypothetical protein
MHRALAWVLFRVPQASTANTRKIQRLKLKRRESFCVQSNPGFHLNSFCGGHKSHHTWPHKKRTRESHGDLALRLVSLKIEISVSSPSRRSRIAASLWVFLENHHWKRDSCERYKHSPGVLRETSSEQASQQLPGHCWNKFQWPIWQLLEFLQKASN